MYYSEPENRLKSSFFQGKIRYLNGCCNTKTGNVFVTESLPKYTIFCYFTACSEEQRSEVITYDSDGYAILSVLAFLVHSLGYEYCPFLALSWLFTLPPKKEKVPQNH